MKLFKHMAYAGALALGALAMASCNEGEEEYILSQVMTGCINWSINEGGERPYVAKEISYRLNTNYTKETCDITIENLALPTGQRFTSLTFSDVPYTVKDNAWRVAKIANVIPSSTTLAPMFSQLEFVIADRIVGDSYYPAVDINYTVSGVKVYSTLSMLVCQGTTVVTSADGSTFTQEQDGGAVYMIALNPDKMTATLAIEGAKFALHMPALNMEFRDIPFNFTSDGKVVMDQEKLATPYVIGSDKTATPFEAATITDFKCSADCANNMILTFACTMRMGPEPETYQVKVDCKGY